MSRVRNWLLLTGVVYRFLMFTEEGILPAINSRRLESVPRDLKACPLVVDVPRCEELYTWPIGDVHV